jgi:hypothetical protein
MAPARRTATWRWLIAFVFIGLLSAGCAAFAPLFVIVGQNGGASPPVVTFEPVPAPTAAAASASVGDFPVGIWVTHITHDDLMAAGYTSQNDLDQNSGTFTMTISNNGTWQFLQTSAASIADPNFEGTFTVDGNHITYTVDQPLEFEGHSIPLTWKLFGDKLVYGVESATDGLDKVIFGAHPWVRHS